MRGPTAFAVDHPPKSASALPSDLFYVSEMPPNSYSTLDLQVEDFERLGVRPDEIRLTVIRRAAAQTSRTLAENQLTEPSDTTALQLSRVTTSAYRLLDPRNRGDSHQRIHVGRILPTVLMWAGQTKFQSQHAGGRKAQTPRVAMSGATVSSETDASMPFQGGGLSEADLIELMELDSTPMLAGQPTWAQSLSDGDILGRTPFLRRWNRWKRILLARWYAVGLAVVLLVLFVGALAFSSGDQSIVVNEVDPVASLDPDLLSSGKNQPAVPDNLGNSNNTVDKAVEREQVLEPINETDLGLTDSSELDVHGSGSIIALDPIPDLIFEIENPVVDLAISNNSSEMSDDTASTALLDKDKSGFLPDPFASPSSTAMPETVNSEVDSDSGSKPVASTSGSEQGEKVNQSEVDENSGKVPERVSEITKQTVPGGDAVADARKYILSLDSVALVSGVPDDLARRLEALEKVKEPLRLGTPKYWAVSVLMIESAWQTKGTSDISRILIDLQHHYDFATAALLVETFLAVNVRSALPETQRHLLANGLVLLDRLVIAAEFELAKQILGSVEPLGRALQDTAAAEYLSAYERVISQARRQSERFGSLMSNSPDTWSQANRGLLGRYYCLVLRRWGVGLPLLSSASESRIAAAAKSELALPKDPSFEDLVALARLWNLNAQRVSGLNRDAMRLHAVSLIQKAMRTASESQRLEFGTELREISETLPDHLRQSDLRMVSTKT
ncbi:hypothetical protein OAF83_02665 [Rubripirellula sp.]|nr:hypothetical protein [Rubripirellula sp.]MDB4749788.1 hypothetical protein [Rubripirellula sp.]